MKKSDRKKARQDIIQKAKLKRQNEIWNPDLEPKALARFHDICEKMKNELSQVSKPASVAHRQHGHERARSHIGGAALYPKAVWPKAKSLLGFEMGTPLSLVLQIFPDEMPVVPESLAVIKLLQVFLELTGDEDALSYQGGAWKIRTYGSLSDLSEKSKGRVVPLSNFSWGLENTVPGYPDNIGTIDDDIETAFNALPNASELYVSMTQSSFGGLKVGGWPTWLTGSDFDDYALQMSGYFIGVNLGFDGIIFIGRRQGEWCLEWEIG